MVSQWILRKAIVRLGNSLLSGGQPYRIASAWVERVTNGPAIKSEDGAALQLFSVLLTSYKNTLTDIGYLSKIENPDSLKKIVSRLPFNLRQKWRDVADTIT